MPVARPTIAFLALLALAGCGGGATSGDDPAGSSIEATPSVPDAVAAAQADLAAAEDEHGPDSIEAARALDTLVSARRKTGWRGADTIALAERAVAIKRAVAGDDSPELADSLSELGILRAMGHEYDAARAIFERALAIREAALGDEHPDTAASLRHLGNVLQTVHEYDAALAAYERALVIQERAFGDSHMELAKTLGNLAALLWDLGDYDAVRAAMERSLAIREASLPGDHPALAKGYDNLGSLYREMGRYAEAREHYERALAIYEGALGADALEVSRGLLNLGLLFRQMGDLEAAESRLRRALAIREAKLDPNHAGIARLRRALAGVLLATDGANEARPLLAKALEATEAAYGARHVEVADVLGELARAHEKAARAGAAQAARARAMSIREEILGENDPRLVPLLVAEGEGALARGDAGAASASFARAERIASARLGDDHPARADALVGRARALALRGRVDEALASALAAETIAREHLRVSSRLLPERQALGVASVRASGLDVALGLARRSGRAADARAAWDALVRSRALVLDQAAARQRAVAAASSDPRIAQLVEERRRASETLANLWLRWIGGEAGSRYEDALERARARKEAAEADLAERSRDYRDEVERRSVGLDDVLAALPDGGALVAFARAEADEGRTLQVALVATRDGEPRVVDLGAREAIAAAVRTWHDEAARGLFVAGRDASAAEEAARRAGRALAKRIWDPLGDELGTARTVFVVPEGPLHLVAFAALVDAGGRYLVEGPALIHGLTAERDLALSDPGGDVGRGMVAVGGVRFGRDAAGPPGTAPRATTSVLARLLRGRDAACAQLRDRAFEPLPASLSEARSIAERFADPLAPVTLLSGEAATEEAFRREARGRRVLHVATHGFFVDEACAGTAGPAFASPLLRAGLVFAGAADGESPDGGDGILTAEEVAAMDLGGVEWAVLSACDTGVGEIVDGEGVLGLRRAFEIAGARSVVMTLWPVADTATRRFMTALYEERFERGASTARAVRDAARRLIEKRRARGEDTHPFHWAAFVASSTPGE